ncbi:hypothetical protein V2G26_006111 [Clonostachys chloroleuca]
MLPTLRPSLHLRMCTWITIYTHHWIIQGVGISISKKLYQGLASIYKLAMAPQDGKPITTTSATTSLQATISDLMLSCLPPRTGSGQLTKS